MYDVWTAVCYMGAGALFLLIFLGIIDDIG
jgi:hypothetical protein